MGDSKYTVFDYTETYQWPWASFFAAATVLSTVGAKWVWSGPPKRPQDCWPSQLVHHFLVPLLQGQEPPKHVSHQEAETIMGFTETWHTTLPLYKT